jgi:hypothetical protein
MLVRKYCQTPLDAAGFSMFHCQVSDRHDRSLQIVTSCGKPLLTLNEITFSRYKPSEAECVYAGELMDRWLKNNEQRFTEFLDAYTAYHETAMPEHKNIDAGNGFEISAFDSHYNKDSFYFKVTRSLELNDSAGNDKIVEYTLTCNTDWDVINLSWYKKAVKPSDLKRFSTIPAAVKTKGKQILQAFMEYYNARKRFLDAQSKMESCKF